MFNSLDPSILTRLPATSIYPRFVSAVTARLFASDSSSSFKPSAVIRHIPSSLSSSSSSVFPESSFSSSTNLWCLSLHSHQTLSDTVWWIWYQRLISEYLLCTLWMAGMSHPLFSSTSLLDRMLLSLSICLLYQTSSYSCALVLRNILVATLCSSIKQTFALFTVHHHLFFAWPSSCTIQIFPSTALLHHFRDRWPKDTLNC